MRYLRVKNFERFQHYKNGVKPPAWLKLYRSILTDSEFMALSDSDRSQLILIWLLASQNHNRVPFDNHLVARQLQTRRVNLQHFIDLKFLLLDDDSREGLERIDATTLATNKKENKKEIPPVAPPSGEPRKVRAKRERKKLPQDFELTQELADFAKAQGLDPRTVFEEFCRYWWADGGRKLDWPATFKNRCIELARRRKAGGSLFAKPQPVYENAEDYLRRQEARH